jgi:nucleotide-binding universal stress UspA family protein
MFQRIVAAIDSSIRSEKVLAAAEHLARLDEAAVFVLHVDESEVVYDTVVDLEDNETASRLLTEAVRRLRQAGVNVTGEVHDQLRGDVSSDILAYAQDHDADLIIMGPHHRTMLAAMLLGSVSHAVDRSSQVSVLLVH